MNLYSASTDGLKWGYYTGYFTDNVSFFTGAPVASGIVTGIPSINAGTGGYVPADQSREYYSVQWTGYFLSNYTGTWTFYTSSDDASYLWIGPNATTGFSNTNAIVINGGLHGMQERSGTVSLVAGEYYPIRIQFGENQQGDNIIVSFSNPNLTKTTNGQGFFYTVPRLATLNGPQPQIFLGPLMSYPTATGTPPSNDGTKLTFARASLQFLNFGSQTFDFTKGLTITCTFAFTGISGNGYERIIDFGPSGYGNNIVLCRNNGANGLWFSVLNDQSITTSSGINRGTYYNVIASYDPSFGIYLYVNGSLVGSRACSATYTNFPNCYIGRSNNPDPYLSADIKVVNVYNRLLTPNELIGTPAPSPWGIFMATPNGLTAAQAATSGLALKQGYPGYTSGTYWIKPTSGSVAGLAFVDMTTDGGGWTLAYETVNATRDGTGAIVYSVNNSSNLSALSFTRVAYSMNNFNSWAFTSFDSWSATLSAHRIPSNVDAFVNQRRVNNLNVVSSNTNVTTGTGLAGALEIWPYNYTQAINTSIGTYGSGSIFDINDTVTTTTNGHGSFQVHDITNLRPVICWNRHRYGDTPEIGFGPRFDGSDWTIVSGIGPTSDFRVRVFVR